MSASNIPAPHNAHWRALTSTAIVVPRDDIDTDQIIPARFLTTTSRTGLGVHCFADWRYDTNGVPRADFPLNQARASSAQILVGGQNFGCGSSREHAPWSILDAGFRAVIAGSFADIFQSNAHRNGLLTVAIGDAMHDLHRVLDRDREAIIHIDLSQQTVSWSPAHTHTFPIDAFSKRGLMEGLDELGILLAHTTAIGDWELRTARAK